MLFVDFVFDIVFLFRVIKKGVVVFVEKIFVYNGVNGIFDVIVIGEKVELVIVVSKVEDCVDFGNDIELFEVDLCLYVGGVGVLVFVVLVMIWIDVLFGFSVILYVVCGVVDIDLVIKMRWMDVDVGIIVFENVGLIEVWLFGVGWCIKVNGIIVLVFLVNILVWIDCGGVWDIIGFVEVKL